MALITRDDIIKAAFRVWGRELYATTSLNDLAGELGVSKAALYRHFRNKEAILEAMDDSFYDDFCAFAADGYRRAREAPNFRESIGIFSRVIMEYYARNVDAFIFSFMQVLGNRELANIGNALRSRGVDITWFWRPDAPGQPHPPLFQMSLATLTFGVAVFHKRDHLSAGFPGDVKATEAEIETLVRDVEEKLTQGLGLQREQIDALDYEALEQKIPRSQLETFRDGDVLRAVAETVAEAGPWNASLDKIARRSGISKSGLYAHFRSKKDMLKRFFQTEFDRMIRYARGGIAASEVPLEQFYLALVSLADYLRSRSEVLMAADWLRNSRLDLGMEIPDRIYQIFSGIRVPAAGWRSEGGGGEEPAPEEEQERISQWILFLVINILMHRPRGADFQDVPNASIRRLFRFICLGIGGFET